MVKGLGKLMPRLLLVKPLMNTITACSRPGISIWFFVTSLIIIAILFGIIGYWIGRERVLKNCPEVLSMVFVNMDNYIIIGSLILLVFSIGLSISTADNSLAVVILNIFSSIIFSWLLTKKTSIKDFKEKEEELALRSYRHINYIESASNTASGIIGKYASGHDDKTSEETRLILSSAKEQIKYIQGGINTCKMDWFDLLSEVEQNKINHYEAQNGDYGTIYTVISDEEINQEDA